jgi:hypothetical protein
MVKKTKVIENKAPEILLSEAPLPTTRAGLLRAMATMRQYGANDALIAKIQAIIDADYPAND